MTDADSSWVAPGAPVLVYSTGWNPGPTPSTIDRVTAHTFTVVGHTDRFSLRTMTTKPHGRGITSWSYKAIPLDSDQAKRLLADLEVAQVQWVEVSPTGTAP